MYEYLSPTGRVQVRQRDDEGMCDSRGGRQVDPPGHEERRDVQRGEFVFHDTDAAAAPDADAVPLLHS